MMCELGDVDEYALQGARGTLFKKNQAAINDHIGTEKVDATNISQVRVGLVGEPFSVKQGEINLMAHSFKLLPPYILDLELTEETCKTLCAEVKAAENLDGADPLMLHWWFIEDVRAVYKSMIETVNALSPELSQASKSHDNTAELKYKLEEDKNDAASTSVTKPNTIIKKSSTHEAVEVEDVVQVSNQLTQLQQQELI
jgi:hypothetical protein